MRLDDSMPGLLPALLASARRDLLLASKRPGDILNPLFFFAMVGALFPLAVGPSEQQLQFIGPGVLWIAALLAMLLSLNGLFLADFEDGSLELLALTRTPMAQRVDSDPQILDFIRSKQPLDGGRIGEPEDADAAVVFFLSDASRFVTGQLLAVDGGWSVSDGSATEAP